MRFAPLFQDHAVLQRHLPLPIWGVAAPGEKVTVRLAGISASVTAEPDGRWLVRLPALHAGGPYELRAESDTATISVQDILIGDVWFCSGQSNMQWSVRMVEKFDNAPVLANQPNIRLFTVATPARIGNRQEEILGSWAPSNAQSVLNFSAVGAWFGHELEKELGVPIGLIDSSWGGTRIQAWMSREALMVDANGREEVTTHELSLGAPKSIGAYLNFEDWEKRGAPQDAGNAGLDKGWALPTHDDSQWRTMSIPSRWQDQGEPNSGIFWFRRSVEVPSGWAGQDLELHLGGADKHDDTYVNGERVGGISWEGGPLSWCEPRVYRVPAHLVGPDRRVAISVRVRSHVYHGGLIGPKSEMYVAPVGAPAGSGVPLDGRWNYAIEQDWGVVTPPEMTGADNPNSPYILFDSRVKPLLPYGIRGAIWYQGESNAHEALLYKRLHVAMIRDWRRAWGQGDFPFLFVQLANYQPAPAEPGPSFWAELRDAQKATLTEPNTGMAVAVDVGDAIDIHPQDKRSVGLRLARWALSKSYGRGGVPSGPLYSHATLEAGGRMRLYFDYASGLKTSDGLWAKQVTIAGRDKRFVWAESKIEGETLVVWHPNIPVPASVRYAWADNPEGCNLVNAEGLPASPFRTDDWQGLTNA